VKDTNTRTMKLKLALVKLNGSSNYIDHVNKRSIL